MKSVQQCQVGSKEATALSARDVCTDGSQLQA